MKERVRAEAPLKVGKALRAALGTWFGQVKGRREMPWRRTADPYAIWVSETMLQQTRAGTALPYYERFLQELPTVKALAEAPEGRVLALWSGLGYYRRARMLHAAARQVVVDHGGVIPGEVAELRELSGVGAYTAGAVASIAFKRRAAVVDGNVARVLARLFAIEDDVKTAAGTAKLWRLAEALVPDGDGDPGDWNQSLMELGATVCVPRAPRCGECPVSASCLARARGIAATLPRTSPRRPPRAVRRAAIVVTSESAVLLARRRTGGLWGGLWEPPSCDADAGDGAHAIALARVLGIDRARLEPAGEVVHLLSHRRRVVEVARAPLGRRRLWPIPGAEYDAIAVARLDDLGSLALASLTRKILAAAARIGV